MDSGIRRLYKLIEDQANRTTELEDRVTATLYLIDSVIGVIDECDDLNKDLSYSLRLEAERITR